MKGYCRYLVIDINTGYGLVCGEKWKEFSGLPFCGSFRSRCGGLRKYTVAQFMQEKRICGRDCVIVYWIYSKFVEPCACSVVSPFGWLLGLSGNLTDFSVRRSLKKYHYGYLLKRHGIWK